jgi:hypothetical protein
MRILLNVTFPHEPFNTLVKQKKAGQILNRILGELKPAGRLLHRARRASWLCAHNKLA